MNMLPVYIYNHQILTQKTLPVEDSNEIREFIKNLSFTLSNIDTAAAIAAPQVGRLLSLFIRKGLKENEVFINPQILRYSSRAKISIEGCLSLPKIDIPVIRNSVIEVSYLDSSFKEVKETLSDFDAIVFQHEWDHLQGIMTINRFEEQKEILSTGIPSGIIDDIHQRLGELREEKYVTIYPTISEKNNLLM